MAPSSEHRFQRLIGRFECQLSRILAGLLIYALRNRILREAGERGEDDDDSTLALLERSDEGGV